MCSVCSSHELRPLACPGPFSRRPGPNTRVKEEPQVPVASGAGVPQCTLAQSFPLLGSQPAPPLVHPASSNDGWRLP